jgi:hypothetical protein
LARASHRASPFSTGGEINSENGVVIAITHS